MISSLERIARDIWKVRFRIPRRIFLLLALGGAAGLLLGPRGDALILVGFIAALGIVGLWHWWVARRRYAGRLVVPALSEGGAASGYGREAQRLIIDDLRRHLPEPLKSFVRPIPVSVGSDEDHFAADLQRRLGAAFVLHGRVAVREGGGWSVFARILEPASKSTTHEDWFTRDRTPANPRFGPLVSNLAPQQGVQDEEFPLEFCRDLEALARGLVGLIAHLYRDYDTAIAELDQSLKVAPKSTNHQVDRLRTARALALAGRDDVDAAITSLQVRRRNPDPAPELLRRLSGLLMERARRHKDAKLARKDRREAKKVLRDAIDCEQDPQRDMSIYNLYAVLRPIGSERVEADRLLDHLLRAPSNYRRQWYVKRGAGLRAWLKAEEAREADDRQAMQRWATEAASWYARAIRARPRLQYRGISRHWPLIRLRRIPRSPILYANLVDAHRNAGHRIRRAWRERQFQRIRLRLMKKAMKELAAERWDDAFAAFDWTIVGRHDQREQFMATYAACCIWKSGQLQEGERRWQEVHRETPSGLIARAAFVQELETNEIDVGVPGSEPTGQLEVGAMIEENPQLWSSEARASFIHNLIEIDPDFADEQELLDITRLIEEKEGEPNEGY